MNRSTLKMMTAAAAIAGALASPAFAQTAPNDEPMSQPRIEEPVQCASSDAATTSDAVTENCAPSTDQGAVVMAPAEQANAAPANVAQAQSGWSGDELTQAPVQVQEVVREGSYTTEDLNRAMLAALRGEPTPS